MANADGHDPAEEIEILLPFHVPYMLHLPALHRHGLGEVSSDRRKNVFALFLIDFVASQSGRSGNGGAHSSLQRSSIINHRDFRARVKSIIGSKCGVWFAGS